MTLPTISWEGCYGEGWGKEIHQSSYAHPAKFSRALVERVLDHMLAEGWLTKDSVCLDPFAGVGLGGILCASRGIQWIGCELEERFCRMAQDNFELHRRKWEQFGDPLPRILCGDSRKLGEVLREAGAVISLPPYTNENIVDARHLHFDEKRRAKSIKDKQENGVPGNYGSSLGQLGSMKAGDLGAVISSPPYSETLGAPNAIDYSKGKTPGGGKKTSVAREAIGGNYGDTEGQLGTLPAGSVDVVVSSPPWEKSINDGAKHEEMHEHYPGWGLNPDGSNRMAKSVGTDYGSSPGQLGSESGETFWSAARTIILQCHAALRPGSYAAWITKDFIKDKRRVSFSADWLRLLEACGFEPVLWVKAMLVKTTREASLFGGEIVNKKERKSFFRRLCESKMDADDPRRIDHEDVLFARRV